MNASLLPARQAARDAAAAQIHPPGALYLLATPIGNLADIGLRVLYLLELCNALACEDTRHTRALLRAYGLDKPADAWIALHEHNEAQAAGLVLARLARGERVGYCSDAGTPAIADPGARLVSAVRAAGHPVVPVPGPCSLAAALSAAGCVAAGAGFVFAGFVPARAAERTSFVRTLAAESRAVVLFEAPHRIVSLARALTPLGTRAVTLAREMTKQHEQVVQLRCDELADWLQAEAHRQRGEFVLVLHALQQSATGGDDAGLDPQARRVLALLLAELPLKTAVRLATEITGAPRNALYAAALAQRR